MRTALGLIIIFLLVFSVMLLTAMNCEPRVPGPMVITTALEWTLHLLGGLAAASAAVGMLIIAAGHGSFQRLVVLSLPLLGGLLLLNANWGVALALGAIVTVWMFKYGGAEIERPTPLSSDETR